MTRPAMKSIRIVGQPKPEDDWLHRFRNLAEEVFAQVRAAATASLEEIDAAVDTFHLTDVHARQASAVAGGVARMIRDHRLDDSVFARIEDAGRRSEPTVILVTDPAFGERLRPVAARRDTWVVASDINEAVVERIWAERKALGGKPSLTIYPASPAATEEEEWLALLDLIEVHHGSFWSEPPLDTLSVYGATPAPAIAAALREYDYMTVQPTALGFLAFKRRLD
jgi:hypothetical protein